MAHLLCLSNNPSTAVDTLEQLFVKANNDLAYVQHKLETEFDSTHASNANPFRLMSRIKKIQEELPQLEESSHKLLAAKQELIDKTKKILVANRAMLRRIQARAGIPITSDLQDLVYSSFMNILHEWNDQLNLQSSEASYENGLIAPEDLNQILFSSKLKEV